ncbi:hypothetical protein QJS04_geneDACA022600 [Acorus gramineus]|uniref:Reverse transcriptase domain-containing protein n=1 Tax=Acorus gramineus TaxID=55184 RepID=A0AAV9BSM9_ACOGR|nr:hypothetical protein QJS04_geneDACA022600 [Acorus gramineus]
MDAVDLIQPFLVEEIESAIKELPRNKAPSPDGLPGEFYQHCWPIIREDVIAAIQHFYQIAQLPISWGSTHTVLIPKKENPCFLKNYRPISICDTKYKIISRILVSQMKGILPSLVGMKQGAFVPG